MGVLKDFRRSTDALERIAAGFAAAARRLEDTSSLTERIQDLERTRGLWEADVEGLLQKAEGKLKAAANAEARERTMQKAHQNESDPFPDDSEEGEAAIQESDVEAGYPEEVLPLRVGVETESKKAYAIRAKFS